MFLLSPLAYLLPLLAIPMDGDEAAYAVVARNWLEGGLPYRDAFDHKPPVIYLWYGLSFVLFGEHAFAPRLLAAVLLSLTAGVLFVLARALFDLRRAYLLTALFGLSLGAVALRFNANTSVFALFPALTSLALLVVPRHRPTLATALAAGVLAGLAVWTRPPVLPAVAAVGLWLMVEGVRSRRFAAPSAYVAGGVLTVPLVLLPFLAKGAIDDAWYALVVYQGMYFDDPVGASRSQSLMYLGLAGLALAPLVLMAVHGFTHAPRRWLTRPGAALVLCWAGGMLLGQAMTGRYLSHYAALMLPALVLLSGPTLETLRMRSSWPRHPFVIALLVALVVALVINGLGMQRLGSAEHPASTAIAAGARIEAMTCPGDSIWEYGRTTSPYFVADRPSPTRYVYDRPFWLDRDTLDEALDDLAKRPAIILDSRRQERAETAAATRFGEYYYPSPLASLISTGYRYAGELDGGVIYVRRNYERRC